jgi:hypothetical protein
VARRDAPERAKRFQEEKSSGMFEGRKATYGATKSWFRPREAVVVDKPMRRFAATRPTFSLRACLIGVACFALLAAATRRGFQRDDQRDYQREEALWKGIAPYKLDLIDLAAMLPIAGAMTAVVWLVVELLRKCRRVGPDESASAGASAPPTSRAFVVSLESDEAGPDGGPGRQLRPKDDPQTLTHEHFMA